MNPPSGCPPLRTAIVGFGRSGSTLHAGALAQRPEFALTAVCDQSMERQAAARNRFDCRTYSELTGMLHAEALDLVCVVSRSDQHCDQAVRCLEAGCNVLVSKPWSLNRAEADRMVAAARASGRALLPWLPSRFAADLRAVQALIADGRIGRVFWIRRSHFGFSRRDDWQTQRRFGGGILLNWGPHLLDTGMLAAGGEVATVYGRLAKVMNPGDAEDIFFASLTMKNDLVVQVEWSHSPAPLPNWFVQGERGTITVRGREVEVTFGEPSQPADPTDVKAMQGSGSTTERLQIEGDLFGDPREVYGAVAATLLQGRAFHVSLAEACHLTSVIDAVRASHEERRIVAL